MAVLTEGGHQTLLFEWAHLARNTKPELRMLFAIPNGGYELPAQVGARLKREGLKAGFPDVGLMVARGCWHGLFIELKKPGNKLLKQAAGVVSADQEMWLQDLHAEGYRCHVCWGWDEARQVIEEYLAA